MGWEEVSGRGRGEGGRRGWRDGEDGGQWGICVCVCWGGGSGVVVVVVVVCGGGFDRRENMRREG